MNTSAWLGRSVAKLIPGQKKQPKCDHPSADRPQAAIKKELIAASSDALAARSTRERLAATLRAREEALSPRVLRRTLEELKAIVDPRISEVEGGRRAQGVARWYAQATLAQRRDMWLLMSEQFMADPRNVAARRSRVERVDRPSDGAAETPLLIAACGRSALGFW